MLPELQIVPKLWILDSFLNRKSVLYSVWCVCVLVLFRLSVQRVRKPRCCKGPQGLLPRHSATQADGQEQLFHLTDNIHSELWASLISLHSYTLCVCLIPWLSAIPSHQELNTVCFSPPASLLWSPSTATVSSSPPKWSTSWNQETTLTVRPSSWRSSTTTSTIAWSLKIMGRYMCSSPRRQRAPAVVWPFLAPHTRNLWWDTYMTDFSYTVSG